MKTLAAILILLPVAALAQTTGTPPDHIVLSWGDWVVMGLDVAKPYMLPLVGTVLTVVLGSVGGPFGMLARSMVTDQVLGKALDFGFGAIDGAVKGKTLNVDTNNAILNMAMQYVQASAPGIWGKYGPNATKTISSWIFPWLSSSAPNTLRAKLFARLAATGAVPADATALDHLVRLPTPPTK